MSTPGTLLQRLRPGLDPNDTGWLLVRSAADWRAAASSGVAYDAGHAALQLAPSAQPALALHWLPQEPVRAADGTLYRCDAAQHRVLARGACAERFTPLRGLGGRGFATGCFDTPVGLAFDAQGRLLVADSGNARVQVIDLHDNSVVAVLDAGLRRPVHVALGAEGEIFVADRGTGRVHVFSAGFAALRSLSLRTLDPWTGEPWQAPPAPLPLAITVTPQGTLAVLDPQRPWLWHLSACGTPLPALPWPEARALPAGWSALPSRLAAQGEVLLGPLDGGSHNFAWHQVLVDAALPAGTSLQVQTFADNDAESALRLWAPRTPLPMSAAAPDGERLVLPDDAGFARQQLGRVERAQPLLHRFDGGGPNSVARLLLPAAAARRLRVGDRVELRSVDGGGATARSEFRLTAAADWPTQVAASGSTAAFTAPASLRLLQRRGGPPAFGPVDLSFLVDPATLALPAPVTRDGRPEPLPMALPHALAAFLDTGDVVEFANAHGSARLEVTEAWDGPLALQLDSAVPGDFSTASLHLLDSGQRLQVDGALPLPGALPPGSRLTVLSDVGAALEALHYIEAAADGGSTLWLARDALAHDVTAANWRGLQFPEARASDRGRYLWVRLQLRGAPLPSPDGVGPALQAEASPLVFSLRVTGPRPSLLRWLPALYSRRDPATEGPGANFLERFLTLFEGRFTQIEAAYESIGRLLNPQAADAPWLAFVAGWLDLVFDPSWPIERRRRLVIEGAALQAARGTPGALRRYLEIYTGAPVAITEGFQRRPPPPIQLGARGALGVAPLGGDPAAAAERIERLAHRFTVSVQLPADIERAAAASAVQQIVETLKPAHTRFVLDLGRLAPPRVGIDTVIDTIVIPGRGDTAPCALQGA